MPKCLHPLHLVNQDLYARPSSGYVQYDGKSFALPRLPRVVPCGKCVNCLRNKRSDFACRICREANKYGSMVFVTFTYRPDSIPFSVTLYQLDKYTGELLRNERSHILDDCELLYTLRSEYAKKLKSREPFYYLQDFGIEDDYYKYILSFTPSLNRRDFRLWLKRERVRYQRQFGEFLPNFSYCNIGEYGPNTLRPHMHCVFMGLSLQQVWRITQSWRDDFGFTFIESVKVVNEDGTSGFVKASQYVAKYLFKGQYDNGAVLLAEAEKGRICCSSGLGCELTDAEISYYKVEDVFGKLDFQNCKNQFGENLSEGTIQRFASLCSKRSVICVNGSYFRLPRSIVRRLFYDTIKTFSIDGKLLKIEYKPSSLRRKASLVIQSNFLRQYWKTFEYDPSVESQGQAYARFRQIIANKESCSSLETSAAEQAFVKSISKSIF